MEEDILKELYKESIILKEELELVELLNPDSTGKGLLVEHLIKKIVNIKIKMYQENHNKPHIHIDIDQQHHVASISIETNELLAGDLPKKYRKNVLGWIEKNKEKLLKAWEMINKGDIDDLIIFE